MAEHALRGQGTQGRAKLRLSHLPARLKQFQEKCEAVFRPELRTGRSIPGKVRSGFPSGIADWKINSRKSAKRFSVRNCGLEDQFQEKCGAVFRSRLRRSRERR